MVKENSDCTIESTGQYIRSFIGISTSDLDNYPIKYLMYWYTTGLFKQLIDAWMKIHRVDLKCSDVLMSWYLPCILSLLDVIFLQLSCSRADDMSCIRLVAKVDTISLFLDLEHHLNRRSTLSNTNKYLL